MTSSRRFIARSVLVATVLGGVLVPVGAQAAPAPTPPSADHLEVLAEHYNLARIRVERATAALEATDRRIDAAQARVALVQARTRSRASALYLSSGASIVLPIGSAAHAADVRRRSRYLDAAENPDRVLLATLTSELRRLAIERTNQRDARDLLQRRADDAQRMKRQLQTLVDAASARTAAAALANRPNAPSGRTPPPPPTKPPSGPAPAPQPGPRPGPSPAPPPTPPPAPTPPGPPPSGNDPPVSPNAGAVVAYARAQLGKPYVFATAGPDTFDCSGLTMAAWASVGVHMPHYSGSQATMFPRVSYAQLQPGDIIAFYGDLHHVGLYIGDGMMIHAPQTGDVVKIAPAWRDNFQWGVRPS